MSVESDVVTVIAALLLLLWLGSSISSGSYARRQLVKLVRASRHVLNEESEVFMCLNLRATHMVPIVHRVWYLWQRWSRLSKVRRKLEGVIRGLGQDDDWHSCANQVKLGVSTSVQRLVDESPVKYWRELFSKSLKRTNCANYPTVLSSTACFLWFVFSGDVLPFSYSFIPGQLLVLFRAHSTPGSFSPRGSCPAPVLHPSAAPTPSICCHGD